MAQRFPQNITPRQGPLNLQYGTLDAVVAAGREAWAESPSSSIYKYFQLNNARDTDTSRVLATVEQQERIDRANLTGQLKPAEGETDASLDLLIDYKREEISRNLVLANAKEGVVTSAATFGGGLFGSLLDPINIGSAFIPFLGHARFAAKLSQTASKFGRFSVRAQRGAVEGAVGAAYVEPIVYFAAQDRQADYDLYDSFANFAFGSILGGGLHGVGGFVKDRFKPPITARQVVEAVEAASPEARHSAMSAATGQLASGRVVQGVDYILRADLESSTALGRVYNPTTGGVKIDFADGVENVLDPVTLGGDATGTFTVRVPEGVDGDAKPKLELGQRELDRLGIDAPPRTADSAGETTIEVPTALIFENAEGGFLSFPTRRDAENFLKIHIKNRVIKEGSVVKIGDEFFILETADKDLIKAIEADGKNIVLPTELPGVRMSQIDTSTTEGSGPLNSRVVPDIDYGTAAVQRSHSPENRVFDFQERQTMEAAQRFLDDAPDLIDEATVQTEIDDALADVDRLKTELEEDELLRDTVETSDVSMREADEIIEETKQTSDGYKQAAACILAGLF